MLSVKQFEELPSFCSSPGKAGTQNWQGEKGHKPSAICNEHVSCAMPARDTEGAQERYRDVQAHPESSRLDLTTAEGNLLIKATPDEKMSHSLRTGCFQTVSLSALIVARETKL